MSTIAAFRFFAGQYHATPWGRNVNEGVVEWPPSPWRLLRALYATWLTRAPELPEPVVLAVLDALSEPPSYVVPEHGEGHTRHYLPDTKHGTDKALDAFTSVARTDELFVEWPVDLDGEQRAVLAELVELVPYLGRAESVCEGRLLDAGAESVESAGESAPLGRAAHQRVDPLDVDDGRTVRLLAPVLPLDPAKLLVRTVDLHKARLLRPPGTRWVAYRLPDRVRTHSSSRRHIGVATTAMRWAIVGAHLPKAQLAVVVADALRAASMSLYDQRHGSSLPAVLTGKDPDGLPSTAQHLHAHHLAFSKRPGGRRLDSLVVWAPGGLDPDVVAALGELTHLRPRADRRGRADVRPLRLGLEAIGSVAEVVPELAASASEWTSFTPFAPSRHAKRRTPWSDHVAAEVRRELAARGRTEPVAVDLLEGDWSGFRAYRDRGHDPDHHHTREPHHRPRHVPRLAGIRLTFAEPVAGPLALGALSHFGLGLFLPSA